MKAVVGTLPTGEGWAYEIKWDGMRALVEAGGAFSVTSANGRDVTATYPDLEPGALAFPMPALVDGEIVALDSSGRPSFGTLQQRMHVASRAEAARRADIVPVRFMVFDLLRLDDRDVTGLTYLERRRLLDGVFEAWGDDRDPRWRTSAVFDDGPALLHAVTDQRLEGVVAKRTDSAYEPGRRSRCWVKVKVRCQQELVVGGWLPGEGGRAGRIGALLVGYHEPAGGPLRFAGRVGTGFTDAELARLATTFAALEVEEPAFDPAPSRAEAPAATWLAPDLVCEVAFTEWTGDGRLRHPVYLGMRDDKDAATVVRE
jgi:bifunctional non-homologous end joining protein LigD